MLACACALASPLSALAQDPAAEVPDIAVSEPQRATSGPSFGIVSAASGPELWATVNICDTGRAPDAMGIRAGMPGNGTRQRMFMRFTAQYWSRSRQDWSSVAGSGVSPWVRAGSALHDRRQAGWTFEFAPPPPGITFTMRALVEFEWRLSREQVARRAKRLRRLGKRRRARRVRHARGVRSVVRATETGIPDVRGGDPAGTSKAMCLIY
ncbi:MAG: hypothetical protein ACRDL0_16650 [Thermoleophilaceae bacterium]